MAEVSSGGNKYNDSEDDGYEEEEEDESDNDDELHETCDVWKGKKTCSHPLHCASGNNNLSAILVLMNEGQDLNEIDSNGNTALHISCVKGYYSIASALVEAGCEIDLVNNKLATPLLAASQIDPNIVQLLIDKGADVNAKDCDKSTPLHIACNNGNADIVELLVHSQCQLDIKDGDGHTPLHCVIIFGDCNPAVIQHLISGGCDVNALDDEEGAPPLFYAVRAENSEVVNMLIENGADVHSFDVLLWALEVKNAEILEILLKCGIDLNECLHRLSLPAVIDAINSNLMDVLKVLLKYNGDVNMTNKEGNTALHLVSSLRSQEMAELLILTGRCNINQVNMFGEIPLHIACRMDCTEIVKLLISNGSDLDACDVLNRTPLHIAVHQQQVDIVRILIKANCTLQVPDTPSLFFLSIQSSIHPSHYIDKTIPFLLLEAGYNLADTELQPLNEWKNLIQEKLHNCYMKRNQDLFDAIKFYSQHPRSLQLLCTISIRKLLGKKLLSQIEILEIPQTLKKYLKFDHL